MDAEHLCDFFNLNGSSGNKQKNKVKLGSEKEGSTAAILSVEGRMHPVDVFYTKGNIFFWIIISNNY